ncbi:MAG TPA: hypothetical protein VM513_12725 [Kofleriaceae bacterium]|nr:hypothetical protein [Kofleriaceae bacterium]
MRPSNSGGAFEFSGGQSDDPVTELYKITVDLDPTTEDKPTVTQLSGKRNVAK